MPRRPRRASGDSQRRVPANAPEAAESGAVPTLFDLAATDAARADAPAECTPASPGSLPGVRGATRLKVQLFGGSAVAAAGMGGGAPVLLAELTQHTGCPRAVAALGGVCLALGAVAGLWLPRRLIRRRLAGAGGARIATLPAALGEGTAEVGFGFVATLAGTLLLVLGLAWVAVLGGAGALESWRATLIRRFIWPVPMVEPLAWTPVLLGMMVLGLVGALALQVLLGWQRLTEDASAGALRLWLAGLIGGLAGAGLAALLPGPAAAVLAPLALFVAAGLVVCRPISGQGRAAGAAAVAPGGQWAGPLIVAGVAVALTGLALGAELTGAAPTVAAAAQALALLLGAAGVGLAVAWIVRRRHVPESLVSGAALLLLSLCWGLAGLPSSGAAGGGWLRLGAGAMLAAMGCALGGPLVARALQSTQRALGWVGAPLIALGVAGLVGAALLGEHAEGPCWVSLPAGAVAVLAGLWQITQWQWRGGVLTAAWLVVLLLLPARHVRGDRAAASDGAVAAAIDVLVWPRARVMCAAVGGRETSAAWGLDRSGPAWDVVVLDAHAAAGALSRGQGQNLLRRSGTALRRSGRLIVVPPVDALSVTGDFLPGPGWVVRSRVAGREFVAVVYDADVPAWLAQHADWRGGGMECAALLGGAGESADVAEGRESSADGGKPRGARGGQ